MKTTIDPESKKHIESCIDTCNRLLEGERSAVQTYDKVLDKFGDDSSIASLQRIRDDHSESVILLEKNIIEMGGLPVLDSGAWGMFANLVQATANLFGEESAVASLQKGEEKGVSDYRAVLEQENLLPACRELIGDTLLPRTIFHVKSLEMLQQEFSE